MEKVLSSAISRAGEITRTGEVASYIPELAKFDGGSLAVAYCDMEGNLVSAGDMEMLFSIQSISKIISLALALETLGLECVLSKVGNMPTSDPFNSIFRLELSSSHKPLNPLINAGAIAVISMLSHETPSGRFDKVIELTGKLTGRVDIDYNRNIYLSEKKSGQRNRALAFFLSSVDVLEGDPSAVLDDYFKQCSIECTTIDLAVMGATLAAGGVNPVSGEQVLSESTCAFVRSLMMICGLYEGSGDFAIRVGFPGKSGVGGGIVGAVPDKMGIATYGPSLDQFGNSVGGTAIMEDISRQMQLRVL